LGGGALAAALSLLGWDGAEDAAAHDKLAKCKKITDKDKRKKCLNKTKKHEKNHEEPQEDAVVSQLPEASADAWVRREGPRLVLEGAPFPVLGVNAHWIGLFKNGAAFPTRPQIDDVFAHLREMGATVVRSHSLGISIGGPNHVATKPYAYNAVGFTAIDDAVASARAHGIRLVVPLTDTQQYYHGSTKNFTDYRSKPLDAFYTSSTVLEDFKNYITHVLRHVNPHTGLALKDDPTVFCWETGN
jgi:hypothetical protein